jgi:hypothetical protein
MLTPIGHELDSCGEARRRRPQRRLRRTLVLKVTDGLRDEVKFEPWRGEVRAHKNTDLVAGCTSGIEGRTDSE